MIGVRHSIWRLLVATVLILLPLASHASEVRQRLRERLRVGASAGMGAPAGMMQFDKISLPYEANVVERIYKDSQGMMWFATRRGLFVSDGSMRETIMQWWQWMMTCFV